MTSNSPIPYTKPYLSGLEVQYISAVLDSGRTAGDGEFTKKCELLIKAHTHASSVLLTPSCTAALELAAILLDLHPGDEVIMPSFTFTSTANAFALRGVNIVFVDVSDATLNISPDSLKKAITSKTKAIVVVHYAGVACDMRAIMEIAKNSDIPVVEDAAQCYLSTYHGQHLGTYGDMGAFSFHETKNISCGEGGALLINNKKYLDRAQIIREKGTNRSKFLLGLVDKYSWCDIGTSALPSEITAAYLLAQLEHAKYITESRLKIWNAYHHALEDYQSIGLVQRPYIPEGVVHNAHIYYVLLNSNKDRDDCILSMKSNAITTPFHYAPLHSSNYGKNFKLSNPLPVTDSVSTRLLRLPLWVGLSNQDQVRIIKCFTKFLDRD